MHFILGIKNPLDHAIRYYPHLISRLGNPYRQPLQLALDYKQGIYSDSANELNFIGISEAQFKATFCQAAIMWARLRDDIQINPIAYMDLDEFHQMAAEQLDRCGPDLDLGNDYLFTIELAEQISPKLHLI